MKEWKRWTPHHLIETWSTTQLQFTLNTTESTNPHPNKWDFYCKSYESEDTKWSGSAVQAIILTEGLPMSVFSEVRQRIKDGGFASWDYTPYEQRNSGQKTKLAYEVFSGKEKLPLHYHVFTKFSARNAPDHILPTEKRENLVAMWEGKKEGIARLDGEFYTTSPLVLPHLSRQFNTVPWHAEELFRRFPLGRVYRSIDPGYDHPTAMAWALLVPGNIWYFYRAHSEQGLTIKERCEKMITMSNNKRLLCRDRNHPLSKPRYIEFHLNPQSEPALMTVADFHLFKDDENTGLNYTLNYVKEGLILTEGTHMRPRERAQTLDNLLAPNNFLIHPLTKHTPGARVFFLINETGIDHALTKMESLFWERLQSGQNKGEAKDEVPTHGDDELDAICYLPCGPYQWTVHQPRKRDTFGDWEPIEEDDTAFTSPQQSPLTRQFANLQLSRH
jgi:hypothetical protein